MPIYSGIKPLVVKPMQACQILNIGLTHCYELINSGALQSYKDGKSRKITVASIEAFVQSGLEKAGVQAPIESLDEIM